MKKMLQFLKKAFFGYLALYAQGIRFTNAEVKLDKTKSMSLADPFTLVYEYSKENFLHYYEQENIDTSAIELGNKILGQVLEKYFKKILKATVNPKKLNLIAKEYLYVINSRPNGQQFPMHIGREISLLSNELHTRVRNKGASRRTL